MEVVFSDVLRQLIFDVVDSEVAACDPVGVASYGAAEVVCVGDVFVEGVITEDDVVEVLVCVGDFEGDEDAPEIGDLGFQSVGVGQSVDVGFSAVFQVPEVVFRGLPFELAYFGVLSGLLYWSVFGSCLS